MDKVAKSFNGDQIKYLESLGFEHYPPSPSIGDRYIFDYKDAINSRLFVELHTFIDISCIEKPEYWLSINLNYRDKDNPIITHFNKYTKKGLNSPDEAFKLLTEFLEAEDYDVSDWGHSSR